MQTRLFLIVILAACGGSLRPYLAPYSRSSGVRTDRPPIMKNALDPSAAFLGLPSLADVLLPQGMREIRLSTGHGMILGAEYPLIRIVDGPRGVVGEVIRFRGVVEARDPTRHDPRWEARIVKPVGPVDWAQVLKSLDSLGVETLVPPAYNSSVSDAGDLTVEVRRGTFYRAYEVNAPHFRGDSVSARAAKIAAFVNHLERQTRGY